MRRLREKEEDEEDERRLLAAAATGRAVSYGSSAEFQDMVARAVKKKFATARPQINHVLVLVSDSPHQIEDMEMRAGAREAVRGHDATSIPYGAVLCWWTPWLSRRWCIPGAASLLTGRFRQLLDEIARLEWWAV